METKKNPKKRLEDYTQLFWQLGLVISMFTIYLAIEYKTYYSEDKGIDVVFRENDDDVEELITFKIEKPVIEQPKPKLQLPDEIDIVDDNSDKIEAKLIPTDINPSDQVTVTDFVPVEPEDIEIDPSIPVFLVEDAPIFPGCEKYAKKGVKAQKKCLDRSIDKHIRNRFNPNTGGSNGLVSGTQKIYVKFKIKSDGTIEVLGVKAPHKSLEKEAERVVKLLPKMEPGRQQGRAVNVTYTKPIAFKVE